MQAQDPGNDPNIFFDPALGASVTLGSQPNTLPFGTSGSGSTDASASAVDSSAASPTAVSAVVTDGSDGTDDSQCVSSRSTSEVKVHSDFAYRSS